MNDFDTICESILSDKPVSSGFDRDGAHTPADPESGSPAYNITLNGTYPEDVYTFNGLRYYGTGEPAMDAEAYRQIIRLHSHPDRQVTIYRAVEKGHKGGIIPGDWVTIVRRYAIDHGKANIQNNYRILSKIVTAKDIYTAGDSWLEWGYHPQPRTPRSAL